VKIVAIGIYYILLDQGRLVDNRYLFTKDLHHTILSVPSQQ